MRVLNDSLLADQRRGTAIAAESCVPAGPPFGSERGFSLLELLVVVGAGVILTGISVVSVLQTLPEIRANSAERGVKGALVFAREEALSGRRAIELQFLNAQEIVITRVNLDNTRTELRRTLFEGNMVYRVYPALPDTPDAFGPSTAVTFPNSRVVFTAEGTAVDGNGLPVSGTVFLGMQQSNTTTARATTVFGATGRIMGYRWDGRAWQQM